jgi:hypothetical protein
VMVQIIEVTRFGLRVESFAELGQIICNQHIQPQDCSSTTAETLMVIQQFIATPMVASRKNVNH